MNEIVARSNKAKDPGILFRRLKEAQMYNPEQFENSFKTLPPEQLYELQQIIGKTKNPNTKAEMIEKYGQVLGIKPNPVAFEKVKRLMK
jgi:hypothetical protein